MKTKKLFLCLLFLVLGTTAWADKYYQPGSYRGNTTPRLTLEQAVGAKFMIYNTAIAGNVDRTGFLRNNGVKFDLDKTKERDLFVYNESFVYTMEKYTDDTGTWYAIKSVNTGLYVNIEGKTDIGSATDAKLYIADWDNATNKSGVNMENWKYNVIANGQITSSQNGSTVFVVKNGNTCWNGNVNAFTTWSDGHPFAFYIAHEVVNGDYLQDLHIYSRCDIFSAQQTYGYVQYANQITSYPSFVEDGGFENLIDGEATTYNVTDYNDSNATIHYYQIDLRQSVESLYLYMQRRADAYTAPIKYELQACATADGEFKTIGVFETNLAKNAFYTSPKITLDGSYQYIRIVAKETTTTAYNKCVGLSELYVLPTTNDVDDAIGYINAVQSSPIYTRATEKVYAALVEEYNRLYSEARLLSGVPIPGNKYRIYADTYDRESGLYVNREIMAEGENLLIKEPGAYHASTADGKKQHEWYCEQTDDGYLVFRNVATPTKYLAYGSVVDSPYKWSINTVETHHYGVPLKNHAMQYLAVANNGEYWQGDVKAAQDQTQPYTYTVPGNTEDDDPNNDVTTTQVEEMGVCTDFLFVPVPLAGEEKKITITGNGIVARNTKLLFDANGDGKKEVYPLPYTRMFISEAKFSTLELQLLCDDIHTYEGIKVNEEEGLNTDIATLTGSVLTFDFSKVNNGDVLNIQMKIKEPFKVMQGDENVTEEPHFYLIRNKHQYGLPQQVRPNRANVNIGIGGDDDEPISSQTGKMFYAKFNQRDTNMLLLEGSSAIDEFSIDDLNNKLIEGLDASSLFYFTKTEDVTIDKYYSANIQNVTTVMKCADQAMWNTNGNTWFVQPKRTTSYTGYNIGREILGATNNPVNVWGANHDEGHKIATKKTDGSSYKANDDDTAWEFVPVSDEAAKKLLKDFIDKVAEELNTTLDAKKEIAGIDKERVEYYRFVADEMQTRAQRYFNGEDVNGTGENPISKLLQFAQNIHMLEHEVQYALFELPDLSTDIVKVLSELKNSEQPHWYYIRNVKGTADADAGKGSYAAYNGDGNPMALQQYAAGDGKKLANMFYFVGEKNSYAPIADDDPTNDALYKNVVGNNLIIDEYLKAHVHNFAAKEVTLVSRNVLQSKKEDFFPGAGQQVVDSCVVLKNDEEWCVELEYELAGNTSFNAYGSCLLASSGEPLADSYTKGFQVYLKDDRSLVVKCGNNDDRYRFWHTQDYFSHIKVVITYSQKRVTVDVYNSLGEKDTKTITGVEMDNIYKLSSALPETGAKISSLATYTVEAMTWKEHSDTINKDEWYILPSSNTQYPGLAIVLDEPNDAKMGWTNDQGGNQYVATDLGTENNSTWMFERVTDFDAHMEELLGIYNFEDCVIYDRELAKLMGLIQRNKALIGAEKDGAGEEALFNEVYYAFLNYKGRMPEELKAPKPGSLYTIRPVVEENTENALLVYVDEKNGTYLTKEVYNADAVRDDKSYDSRAAWMFEGADGTVNAGLKAKNIHTQCYLTALGDDASAVNEVNAASITLAPLGGCTTMFQVGGVYMDRTAVATTISYNKNANNFWGSAVTASAGVQAVITENDLGDGAVHCKSTDIEVRTTGDEVSKDVTVTFTYDGGNHKINILGVELVTIDGKVKYSNYLYQTAGSSPNNIKTYTLAGVLPGTYTLNCYVYDPASGDDLTQHVGHIDITGVSAVSGEGKIVNTGAATTKWIVEEIKNPEESVYFAVSTYDYGSNTLKLGFPAYIPEGVEAFYAKIHGDIKQDRYVSMVSYGEPEDSVRILPSNTAVIIRNVDGEAAAKEHKFYYSATDATPVGDKYLHGALYYTVINCASYDTTDFDGDGDGDGDVNIYMLQSNKGVAKLYWIYEEREADGSILQGNANTDNGGYIACKANKAFVVLPKTIVASISSFSLRYENAGLTDIEEIGAEDVEVIETIYDIQGRKLKDIAAPGVYIVNGKKIFVK